jgi:hypothetical protein
VLGNAQADKAEVDVAKIVVSKGEWFETEISRWPRDDLPIRLHPRDIAHLPPSLQNPQVQLTRHPIQPYEPRVRPYFRLSDGPKAETCSYLQSKLSILDRTYI